MVSAPAHRPQATGEEGRGARPSTLTPLPLSLVAGSWRADRLSNMAPSQAVARSLTRGCYGCPSALSCVPTVFTF
eukprot:scaffold120848_cov33-Tisochrysis_lutea.AAC.1